MPPRAGTLLAWVVILYAALVAADVDPVVIKVSFNRPNPSRIVLMVNRGLTFLLPYEWLRILHPRRHISTAIELLE
jgi:1,3-beta-glucanosyltransferase GAS1